MSNEKILDVFKKHETEGGVYLEQGIIDAMTEYAELYHAEQTTQKLHNDLIAINNVKQQVHNIEQILGRALGFAELDGFIVTSEYNAEILAGMAADAITKRTDALKYYYKLASEKVAANADRPMSEAHIEANACKVLLEILLSE